MKRQKLNWQQKLLWTIILLITLLIGSAETLSFPELRHDIIDKLIRQEVIFREQVRYYIEVTLGRTE